MKTFILLSALILVFIFSTAIGQVSITLHPDQDAVIGFHDNYNSANTNYGSADYYGAFSQPGASGGENAAHSLMEFDLSDIPAGSTINSATLTLYGRGATNNSGDATSVGNIGDNPCYLEQSYRHGNGMWLPGTRSPQLLRKAVSHCRRAVISFRTTPILMFPGWLRI